MHCVGGGGREEAIGTADGCRLYGGGCRLYEGAALRVGHDRGAVRVRDFRRATMRSVEEFYQNEEKRRRRKRIFRWLAVVYLAQELRNSNYIL